MAPLVGFDSLMHPYNCPCVHLSSPNSLAELRLSGSHCSIFRIRRRKSTLSCSSRVVSLFSSGVRSCNEIPAQKSPTESDVVSQYKNSLDNTRGLTYPRLKRICGLASLGQEAWVVVGQADLAFQRRALDFGKSEILGLGR